MCACLAVRSVRIEWMFLYKLSICFWVKSGVAGDVLMLKGLQSVDSERVV